MKTCTTNDIAPIIMETGTAILSASSSSLKPNPRREKSDGEHWSPFILKGRRAVSVMAPWIICSQV